MSAESQKLTSEESRKPSCQSEVRLVSSFSGRHLCRQLSSREEGLRSEGVIW